MRAVNLIPADARKGGNAAGRSGGNVYVVLGALGLLVVMAGLWTTTSKSAKSKKNELATISAQADSAEAKSNALTSYTSFASLRAKRVSTVKQIADSRFDWAFALHEVARVVPKNAWLTTLTGTVSPTSSSAGSSSSLRSARSTPAISVSGCTTSQASVARFMARMRLIDGVDQVSLQDSTKGGGTGGGGDSAAGGGACATNHFPQFNIVVFFEDQAAVPVTGSTTQTASAVSTTTPASSTAPASTTTPAAAGGSTP